MTRRERMERRLERRQTWAAGRQHKAESAFQRAHAIADNIPFGQPILVGHHSERHARRDAARIESSMRAGCESLDMAKHHAAKAGGIQDQLDRSIFTDDHDAPTALREKIATLEAERDRCKRINKEIGKGPGWEMRLREAGFALTDREKQVLLEVARFQPYYCKNGHPVFPTYHLSNLGGNIRRLKGRLDAVDTLAAQRARVAVALAAEEEASA